MTLAFAHCSFALYNCNTLNLQYCKSSNSFVRSILIKIQNSGNVNWYKWGIEKNRWIKELSRIYETSTLWKIVKKLTISQLIILEYIETIINQILYYRFMYPESAFIPLKKYSLACHFVRGDIMTDYLSTMLNQIESALKNNSLRKVKT